jgi:predicted Zn-dependent protease
MKDRLLSASLTVGIALAAACATNPVTGERELMLVSEAQEIEMGRTTADQVAESMGLYDDPELAAYVSEIGHRLARDSERPELPWQFHVLDTPVVNAFALPGGPVYLTRGILAHMGSEAAMVGVLGHEIGHITARHSAQQISRATLAGFGLGVGAVFFPETRPFGDLLQTGLGLLFLKFGRDDERQADSLGVKYSVYAGYSPADMAGFFRVLRRLGEQSGRSIPSWLSTHPDPEDREESILRQGQTMAPPGESLVTREEEFKRRLEGLVYGENPRQGFMDGSRFKHPDLRFQIDFPGDWSVENTRQALYAAPADGAAAIQLTASTVSSSIDPQEHAGSFFRRHELEYGTGERLRIGGFPAYRAPFRVRTSAGTLSGEAAFVVDGEVAYEIVGLMRQGAYQSHRPVLLGVMESFERLRDPEALAAQPLRIALYRVPTTMSLREALEGSGADEALFDELGLVNGLELEDNVEAGTLLKTVRR